MIEPENTVLSVASMNNTNATEEQAKNTNNNHQQIKNQPSAIFEDGDENINNESDNKVIFRVFNYN